MSLREQLADEALRYLAAVDLFRAEGYPPTWRPDLDDDHYLAVAPPTEVQRP